MNKTPSPEQAARLERQRLAAEDGSKAMQEVLDAAIAVRANMARLRALRLAKEADGVTGPRALTGKRFWNVPDFPIFRIVVGQGTWRIMVSVAILPRGMGG